MHAKTRTVLIAILVSLALTILKTCVGLLTRSISVLSSALDSFMDVCSMSISFAAVRAAEKPADENHPFGHGKAEAIAGLFQATFIAASAAFLIVQAFHRMIDGYILEDESVGIAMMAIAIIASIFLTSIMRRTGRRTQSTALEAGALNFGADIWTNAGVLIALLLERWASIRNADPIISVLISLYIVVSAIRVGHDAIAQLMDLSLPSENLAIIDGCIRAHGPMVKGYHQLRTRRVGAERLIDFHLEIDRSASFEQAHLVSEAIIADIRRAIPGAQVTVHSDPV